MASSDSIIFSEINAMFSELLAIVFHYENITRLPPDAVEIPFLRRFLHY
jgi:hypothetical protein